MAQVSVARTLAGVSERLKNTDKRVLYLSKSDFEAATTVKKRLEIREFATQILPIFPGHVLAIR